MPYIYFTDEQKLRANSVDLERYLLQNGEELIRSGPEKRLKSDKSITIRGSEWFDHAQAVKTGGGPVAFVMYHYGLSYPEAMIRLLGGEQGVVYEASPRKEEPEPKEFALPPAGESMRRVYAYLLKQRFISREVLNTFVSQSCTPFAEAASISAGKQSRAKIRKQAQLPNSKAPFFMQSLP